MGERVGGRGRRASRAGAALALACTLCGCAYLFDADGLAVGAAGDGAADARTTPASGLDGGDGAPPVVTLPDGAVVVQRFCERNKGLVCLDFDDGITADDLASTTYNGTLSVDDRESFSPPRSFLATTASNDGEATVHVPTPALVGRNTLTFRVKAHMVARLTMLVAELYPEGLSTSRDGIGIFLIVGKLAVRLKDTFVETEVPFPEGVWTEVRVEFSTKAGEGIVVKLDGKDVMTRPNAAIPPGKYDLRYGAWGATLAMRYDDILLQSP